MEQSKINPTTDNTTGETTTYWSILMGNEMKPFRSMTKDEIRREKISIWKNVSVVSLSFMCLFTAFYAVSNLQSSINSDAGLGTVASSTIYAAMILSCMFVPSWIIKTIKCKWTLVFCQLGYSTYIIAQFWPTFYTLIPTAIIVGFCAAPMWSAKCIYLTQVGNRYAVLSGEESAELSITRLFGFFFMLFQMSQIWGNLISSLVLSMDTNQNTTISYVQLELCGANFCNQDFTNITGNSIMRGGFEDVNSNPPKARVNLLSGILLGISLLATVIIAFLLDPLTRYGENQQQGSNSTGKSGLGLLIATFVHMKNPYQILLIPLTLWSGFEQAFLAAEYTEAFISCSWGVENIGYVLVCYGVCDAVGSICFGSAVKAIGRVPILVFASLVNAALIIVMFLWRPNPSEPVIFFVIAGLWGLADSIWQTLISAFYGVIFPTEEEAAFSNYRLWQSLGFTIAFSYSSFICADDKLYVLSGILLLGMIGYFVIELQEHNKNKLLKGGKN